MSFLEQRAIRPSVRRLFCRLCPASRIYWPPGHFDTSLDSVGISGGDGMLP
jgi:hypothetical protein